MTIKLWLLSILISAIAPYIVPKCTRSQKSEQGKTDPHYQPGSYFENTMSLISEDQIEPGIKASTDNQLQRLDNQK